MRNKLIRYMLVGWICAGLHACENRSGNNATENETAEQEKPLFFGMVTFTSTITSSDTVLINSLRTFSPEKVDVYFQRDTFRMIEHGGLSHGNILIFMSQKTAWQIDTIKKMAFLGEYSDLGDPSAALKDLMPDHFAPTVESTGVEETIAGTRCTKYRITRSGVIPKDDTAYIWAANNIRFPSSRFDIQTEVNHAAVPPPLFIGYEDGAVMRLQVINKKYERIFEVTALKPDYFPAGIFSIPEGYQKK